MFNKKIGIKSNVFISWNHNDEEILNKIVSNGCFNLPESKTTVWDSNGSGSFGLLEDIKKQIDLCDTFLILLSVNSLKSQWCYDEFVYAYNSINIGPNNILPIIVDYEAINAAKDVDTFLFEENDNTPNIWKLCAKFKDKSISVDDVSSIEKTIQAMMLNKASSRIINTKYNFEIKNFYSEYIYLKDVSDL